MDDFPDTPHDPTNVSVSNIFIFIVRSTEQGMSKRKRAYIEVAYYGLFFIFLFLLVGLCTFLI